MSFTEEISGLLFEVCNHCMTDKEKEDQGKIEREALFLKYN